MDTDTEVLGSGAGEMRADDGEADTTNVQEPRVDGRTRRRKFGEDIWGPAEAEYFAGAPAREVCARYGMSQQTFYLRVGGRGKRSQAAELKAARAAGTAPDKIESGTAGEVYSARAIRILMLAARFFSAAGALFNVVASMRVSVRKGADGRIIIRRVHTAEAWAAARRDYEEGGFTVPVIAERYEMSEAAVKGRARRESWSKKVKEVARPLLAAPDPTQVEIAEDGRKISAWAKIAFAPQLPPEGAWSTWLFQGGRGAGKTRAGAEWLAERAEKTPNGLFALVGPTQHDVREVMVDGPSGVRSLPGRERPWYERSRRRLTWKNGAVAYAFSAEEPERLRGPQFMAAWADEFCIWPKPEATLALLRMGLRLGDDPRLVVTTTPKPIVGLRKLRAEVSCVTTQAPTRINTANLTPTFLEGLDALYGGTRLARQELEGELLDGDGALWTRAMLAKARGGQPVPESGKFERVVVGVDPPAGAEGSVCGIVVVGLANGRGYVLEDASCAGATPAGWAAAVAQAAKRHGARKIIAERNMGGDMVRTTLLGGGVTCAVELVHASEAKQARAQPVSALYERERVTHCGDFPQLEEEMLTLGVPELEKKLDRADALVWALTSLMITPKKPPPRIWPL
ncbi:MAG: terminase family protein [Hyphomonadaceae bacterium]|nr:terminase family protein [Hyphomonadaceae bacterium]